MDNVNDYQALRVKAAFLAINSIWVEPDYDVPDLAKAALKAADSIPLPQESELVEVVARAAWKRDQPEPNDLYETFGDLPDYEQEIYRDEVKPLLQALRPALAAMAGNGGWRPKRMDEMPPEYKDGRQLLMYTPNGGWVISPAMKEPPREQRRKAQFEIHKATGEWPDNGWNPIAWAELPPAPAVEGE